MFATFTQVSVLFLCPINPFHSTNLFWYPQKPRGFLMFSESIERDQRHEWVNQETLKSNNLLQSIVCFFRKQNHTAKTARPWVFGDPSHIFYLKNGRKPRFQTCLHFHARNHRFIILTKMDGIHRKLWISFQLRVPGYPN